MVTHEAPRVEVPKPHTFSGKRDANELDNFFWHMECYFEAISLRDEAIEVHTDALNFTIGGFLMQDRHLIVFESCKLNDMERRYMVQEKEMTAIIYYLRTWRHYLIRSHFIVKTSNVATSNFQT